MEGMSVTQKAGTSQPHCHTHTHTRRQRHKKHIQGMSNKAGMGGREGERKFWQGSKEETEGW